ncbi:MAG TPA: MraY family glycosyltransferase, partial [Anaerolineae bacterium]|nr:MraY family glycosyltransferase [Anaerolineae bacterium]
MAPLLIVFFTAFILSLVLTPIAGRIGLRFNLADAAGGRRQHMGRIARTGGLALYISFVIALLISQSLNLPRSDPNEATRLIGLLFGASIMFIFGLFDDRFEFKPGLQFVVQALASMVAIVTLIIIERFNDPISNQQTIVSVWLYIPLTLFWLMGMMNTVNWLDGLDGLAAGISAIFSIILLLAMLRETPTQQPQISLTPLPLALLGATLGFLPY